MLRSARPRVREHPRSRPAPSRREANTAPPPSRASPGADSARATWGWLVAAAVIVLSAILVVWAKTRPGFDPYGWLTWGHMTLHGGLDTNAAPSWKPLPYVFTVVYALLGSHELRLWMITSAAVSLAGVDLRGAHRLQAHRRPARAALGGLGRGDLRRARAAGHPGLLPLHPQLPVGSDDRRAMPGGDRPAPRRPHAAGVRCRGARRAGSPGGVAVPGPLCRVGVGPSPRHPPRADRRSGGDGAAVVRRSRAHLAHAVRGRRQRDGLRSPADLRSGRRHHPALPGAALLAAGGRRAARGDLGGVASVVGRPRDAGARRRRGRLGDRGDRLRPARLARPGALHVRGGRRDDRARRGLRRTGAGRPATAGRA